MVYRFFDKARSTSTQIGTGISENYQLANELNRSVTRKLKKEKYILLLEITFGMMILHLAEEQLLSKCNNGLTFSLCTIGIYSKYAWVVLSKDIKSYHNH